MSFKDLKVKRDTRTKQATLNTTSSSKPSSSESPLDSQLYSVLNGSTLEIKPSPDRGRGLWTKSSLLPGTRLLSVVPHIHVLSSKFLETHCSSCVSEVEVRRCTKCMKTAYCSPDCQKNDWKLHKEECKALVRWSSMSPSGAVPADSIRAIGRLLWSRRLRGSESPWWHEIEAMQSNREHLSFATQEAYTHFAQSLVMYLDIHSPDGLAEIGIGSPRALVDLMSRFSSNSFTLTSPSLNPIGVAISPPLALVNHSCRPNAVVHAPRLSKGKAPTLDLIAIAPINAGDEIEAAYVDITLPKAIRQKPLQETYSFTCKCPECSRTDSLDPRESYFCPSCGEGLVSALGTIACTRCGISTGLSGSTKDKLLKGKEGLDEAESLQRSDPARALTLSSNLLTLIAHFSPPASHPRLALMRLKHSLLISNIEPGESSVDETIRNAAQVVAGLTDLLPKGHPIRGVAIAELGKLLCVDEPPVPGEGENETFPPRGYQRLVLAKETLLKAKEEIELGFGRDAVLEGVISGLLESTDRELQIFRKGVKNAKVSNS